MKRLMTTTALIAALLLPAEVSVAQSLWNHNGSPMRLIESPGGGIGIYYEAVRPGLRQTIPPGAPRFEGQQIGGRVVGDAFVYTKYCPGARFPYHVEGWTNGAVIELYGPAAVVDPYSCTIVGYRADSDNAHVSFQLIQPAPVVVVPPVVVPVPPIAIPPVVVPPVVGPPSCIGICAPIQVAPTPAPRSEMLPPMSTAERARDLRRQADALCKEDPSLPECSGGGPAPTPAVPYTK